MSDRLTTRLLDAERSLGDDRPGFAWPVYIDPSEPGALDSADDAPVGVEWPRPTFKTRKEAKRWLRREIGEERLRNARGPLTLDFTRSATAEERSQANRNGDERNERSEK